MPQPVAAAPVTAVHGQLLLDTAAASIRHGLAHGRPLPVDLRNVPPAVLEPRPVFVTLERRGVVRGCVGRLHSPHPLIRDVADNAYNAAFQDSRFPPLEEPELDGLSLQISVLSRPSLCPSAPRRTCWPGWSPAGTGSSSRPAGPWPCSCPPSGRACPTRPSSCTT